MTPTPTQSYMLAMSFLDLCEDAQHPNAPGGMRLLVDNNDIVSLKQLLAAGAGVFVGLLRELARRDDKTEQQMLDHIRASMMLMLAIGTAVDDAVEGENGEA